MAAVEQAELHYLIACEVADQHCSGLTPAQFLEILSGTLLYEGLARKMGGSRTPKEKEHLCR